MRGAWVLACLAACQSAPVEAPARLPTVEAAGDPVPPPADLMAYAGVRSPSAFAATIASLLPASRALDVSENLARALRVPPEAAEEIDAGAPVWLAYPSAGKGHLAIVTVRDEARFVAALSRTMRADGTSDGLARYVGEGRAPVHLATAGRHAVIVDSPETWSRLGPYALRSLLPRDPSDDLELHVLVEHLAVRDEPGLLERGVDAVLARLLEALGSPELSDAAKDQAQALAPLVEAARPWIVAVAGAREVELRITLDPSALAAKLSVVPAATGRARELVAGTRDGPLLGADRLPPRAWLTAGAHGHPSLPSLWAPIVLDFAASLADGTKSGELRQRLAEVAARSGWTGDYTLVARADPDGTRFAGALLLGARDARDAERALADVIATVARPRPLSLAGAQAAHGFELPPPAGAGGGAPGRLVDTAAIDGIVVVAFGEAADRHIAELVDARPRKGAPPEPERGRDGLVRLSPVGLARTFVASLPLEQRVAFRDVLKVRDEAPFTISWGVDATRTRWVLETRVPIATIVALVRPFVSSMRRAAPPAMGPIGW